MFFFLVLFFCFLLFTHVTETELLRNSTKEIVSEPNQRKVRIEISSRGIGARNSEITGTISFCPCIPPPFGGLLLSLKLVST